MKKSDRSIDPQPPTVEQEIWNDFENLSGYGDAATYGEAKIHFGIKPDERIDAIFSSQQGKFLYGDVDHKINKLLESEVIDWDRILLLYPKTHIKPYIERVIAYPPPKFRTRVQHREIESFIQNHWLEKREAIRSLFPNENTAKDYLIHKKWDGNPCCPKCESHQFYIVRETAMPFQCAKCRYRFNARSATIFQGSKLRLIKWYEAIYLLTGIATVKISTPQLSKALSVTQPTAWHMAKKIQSKVNDQFIVNIRNGISEHMHLTKHQREI